MGFPTVKSDPWKAKAWRVRGRRRHLWSDAQWKELVKRADRDRFIVGRKNPISDGCLELIREFNGGLTH